MIIDQEGENCAASTYAIQYQVAYSTIAIDIRKKVHRDKINLPLTRLQQVLSVTRDSSEQVFFLGRYSLSRPSGQILQSKIYDATYKDYIITGMN